MKYITVCDLSPKAKYYVARQLIGADRFVVVAVCANESSATQICNALNAEHPLPEKARAEKYARPRRAA
jgi:hypothetical protein